MTRYPAADAKLFRAGDTAVAQHAETGMLLTVTFDRCFKVRLRDTKHRYWLRANGKMTPGALWQLVDHPDPIKVHKDACVAALRRAVMKKVEEADDVALAAMFEIAKLGRMP
jgi:hypothetical protein